MKELEKTYEKLENAMKRTYWVFTPEEQNAFDKRLQAIKDQIAARQQEMQLEIKNGTLTYYSYYKLTNEIKRLREELNAAKLQGDMLALYQAELEILEQEKQDLQEAIKEEEEQKKTDTDKIEEWEGKITTIENKMEDLKYEMQDTLAGTDVKSAIDEFGDAIWDAIVAGEKAMDAFGDKVQDVLKNAVKEALKRQFLAKGINDAIEYLGTAMEDSVLTDEERARFEELANLAGETYKNAIEGLGDWIMNGEEDTDAMTGAVRGMSEETGGLLAGRLNAVVINQSQQMEILRNALIYQAEIAHNTGVSAEKLTQIQESVKRIENRENNLLSQGIS